MTYTLVVLCCIPFVAIHTCMFAFCNIICLAKVFACLDKVGVIQKYCLGKIRKLIRALRTKIAVLVNVTFSAPGEKTSCISATEWAIHPKVAAKTRTDL